MDELTTADEPLNPYSGAFFGLWALVVIFMIGFQFNSPSSSEPLKNWHREGQTERTTYTGPSSVASAKLAVVSQQERPKSIRHKKQYDFQ